MTHVVDSVASPGEIALTLPDGSIRHVASGTTGAALAESISPRLAKAALAVMVDDQLVDLSRALDRSARIRIVTGRDPEALALYRHSTAHLLAAAVLELFPGTQCGIGPAIDDGFFYDFVVERPFVPEDLARIEASDARDCRRATCHSSGSCARRPTPRRSLRHAVSR